MSIWGNNAIVMEGQAAKVMYKWLLDFYALCNYKRELEEKIKLYNAGLSSVSIYDIHLFFKHHRGIFDLELAEAFQSISLEAEDAPTKGYNYIRDYDIKSLFVDHTLYIRHCWRGHSSLVEVMERICKSHDGDIYWGSWSEGDNIGQTNDQDGKYFEFVTNDIDNNSKPVAHLVPKFDFDKL